MSAPNDAALGALLAHRENAKLVCWTLLRHGYPRQDVQDGLQDVYLKALESFQRKAPPDTLERMMALCAEIAKNHAIDAGRKAAARRGRTASTSSRASPPGAATRRSRTVWGSPRTSRSGDCAG